MKQYLDLLDRILTEGHKKTDRTGTGNFSVYGNTSLTVITNKTHTCSI